MPQIWDVRIDETDEQKARNDAEVNAVVAYVVEKSAREAYPAPPKGDLEAGRKIFETRGLPGLPPHRRRQARRRRASTRPRSAPTARTSTAPAAR